MTRKEFYTVAELEQMFDYTASNIYRLIREGQLEATTIGKRYIITAEALEKYKATRKGA